MARANPANKSDHDGTYNIYERKKGTTRWRPRGSFDWYTHEHPYQSAQKWLQKAKSERPDVEFQIKNGHGKVINMGRPRKGEGETKVVSARLNKTHLDVLALWDKDSNGDAIIKMIEDTSTYKRLVNERLKK